MNTIRNIYLTIDDAPSIHMHKKVDFLFKHHIPAIFYCRGEFIEKSECQIINAIEKGFLIGNHSYSHAYFSQISLEECLEEILKTEVLIEKCYKEANIQRPYKVMRFPFGDRGAGRTSLHSQNEDERNKVYKLQKFLFEKKFSQVDFGKKEDTFIDASWDWDPGDYKTKFIKSGEIYKENLRKFYENAVDSMAVLLLHDFDHTHHLFEITMDFLMHKNINFLPYRISERAR